MQRSNTMKRLFIRLTLFASIIVCCDAVMGFVGVKLINSAKGGRLGQMNYTINSANEDILIFGSSRARYHYDPNIFEDTLCMTAYNCGIDGSGIICAYGFFKMLSQRYYPKILIYDITPWFDLSADDNLIYMKNLRYFYNKSGVDSIVMNIDRLENYKMISRMYRFNTILPQLMINNFYFRNKTYPKGYTPLDIGMRTKIEPIKKYDDLKLYYIERLINDCKGKTILVFTVSPLYKNTDDGTLKPVRLLCEKHGIPFLNYYSDTTFNNKRYYFADKAHLNRRGSIEYSKVVAREIKHLVDE